MRLSLRQLPPDLALDTELKSFLTRLGQQLTLSIPKQNKIVKSDGFRVEDVDTQNNTVEVVYLFKTDLANFSHVELILSSSGNPLFMPVPVTTDE